MKTYNSPYEIGLGDSVNYNFKNYLVLINYIEGETDDDRLEFHKSDLEAV